MEGSGCTSMETLSRRACLAVGMRTRRCRAVLPASRGPTHPPLFSVGGEPPTPPILEWRDLDGENPERSCLRPSCRALNYPEAAPAAYLGITPSSTTAPLSTSASRRSPSSYCASTSAASAPGFAAGAPGTTGVRERRDAGPLVVTGERSYVLAGSRPFLGGRRRQRASATKRWADALAQRMSFETGDQAPS